MTRSAVTPLYESNTGGALLVMAHPYRSAVAPTRLLQSAVDRMNERISIHPRICHGQACIHGTRIAVLQIVRMFAHGDSIDTLLGAYPTITREDILACLDYAASLAEDQVSPLDDIVLTS